MRDHVIVGSKWMNPVTRGFYIVPKVSIVEGGR